MHGYEMALVFNHLADADIVALAHEDEFFLQVFHLGDNVVSKVFDHDDTCIVLILLRLVVIAMATDIALNLIQLLLNEVGNVSNQGLHD